MTMCTEKGVGHVLSIYVGVVDVEQE